MKKLARIILGCTGLLLASACILPPEAGIKITSDGNDPVAFSGYYSSEVTDTTHVDGVTAASYKVKVNTASDRIRAAFFKTDTTDAEIRVQLFYRGKWADITVNEPGDTAFIDYKVNK